MLLVRARRHRLRPARLLREPDQDAEPGRHRGRGAALQQHAHDGVVLTDAGRASCHRPQPPHANGMACITELERPAIRATTGDAVRERDAVGDPASMPGLQHVHGREVASDAEQPGDRAAGPYDRWPLGRGFQRFYGFLGGDTSQWTRSSCTTTTRSSPPKKPEEGYHLSEDLVDKAVTFIADSKQADPEKPFLPPLCPRRHPRPAPRGEGVGGPVQGRVRRPAGTPTGRRRSRGRRSSGSCPPTRSCHAMIRDVPDWDASIRPRRRGSCMPG